MKLKIMKLINSNKNWRDILSKPPYNLSIKDDGKYTIIKYNQLFSDFKEPIVREARGLIIKKSGYAFKLVCMPFTKFFALGDPNALGDLKSLYMKRKWLVEEKVDGSLIKLFYDEGKWNIATNGTIDASKAEVQEGENSEFPNYLALFKYASKDKIDYSKLNQHYTYMFELVSPENKVVCAYNTSTIYYLGRRNIKTLKEVSYFEDDCLGLEKCKRPRCTVIYPKTSPKKAMAELKHKVDSLTTSDENFEGVVISDEGLKSRIKIKSSEYLRLSKIKGNGILTDKKILFMIINSLDDDAIQAFPEYRPKFEKVKSQLSKWIDDINKDIEYLKSNSWNNQKEFAEWAKETTYSPFMFTAYKSENDFNLKEEIQKMNLDKLLLEIKKKKGEGNK